MHQSLEDHQERNKIAQGHQKKAHLETRLHGTREKIKVNLLKITEDLNCIFFVKHLLYYEF
jgi:hypothetical protein